MDITKEELTEMLETAGEAIGEALGERFEPIEKRLVDLEASVKTSDDALSKIIGARKSLDSQEPVEATKSNDSRRDAWGRRIHAKS